jgi:phytoene dehydrogenase-like protein
MTNTPPIAVVIGAGIGGLTAATYLARAGVGTMVVEARPVVGGAAETAMLGESFRAPLAAHTVFALDRRMVRDLALHKHGLVFAEREMPLVALRPGGEHLVLQRCVFAARSAIRAHAEKDGDAYLAYRRALFTFARTMRPLWFAEESKANGNGDPIEAAAKLCQLSRANVRKLEMFARTSASAHLDQWFEYDTLKAALAFDVCAEDQSPMEAGTAMLLAWRAAQEMGGLQGTTAQFRGGPLAVATALAKAAQDAGAVVRTTARVQAIATEGGKVTGIALATGELLHAQFVLSSLGRADTLDLLPPEASGFGASAHSDGPAIASAKVLLGLNGPVPIAGLTDFARRGRLVIAERPESAAEAKGAALTGVIPGELVLEVTIPSAADPSSAPIGQETVSVMVPFLPAQIEGGWDAHRATLLKRVLSTLENYAPGLGARVIERAVFTPKDLAARYGVITPTGPGLMRLLSPAQARVHMPMSGLYLCGGASEPADAVSGTAGRTAAMLALAEVAKAKGAAS